MSVYGGPDIVTDGLILHLDAGNHKSYPGSGIIWNDLSGNNNHGTLINGPYYSSLNTGYIVFDGTNDYVSFTNTPQIAQSVYSSTIEIIAYRSRTNAFEVIFGGGTESTNNALYMGFRGTPSNFMYAYYGNDQDGLTPLSNSLWNRYAAIYNNSTQGRYRYFNNSLLSPFSTSGITNTSANRFFLGAFNGGTVGHPFQGNISLIRIYNRELNSTELTQNYNALKGRYRL